MKKRFLGIISIILCASMVLSGCGATTATSVEDEVSKNLQAKAPATQEEIEPAEEEIIESPSMQPDTEAMTDDALETIIMSVEAAPADDTGNIESEHAIEDDDVDVQIVFLGDSIFDSVRDETGIAKMVGANLGADVYNLAIGGTTCALKYDKPRDFANWTEYNFLGMVFMMTNQVDPSLITNSGLKAGEIFKTCDFSQTDYFVIEYGTNDFLTYIPKGTVSPAANEYYTGFRQAYDFGINELKRAFPNAQIIICTPYYEEFWSADHTRYIGDAHMTNNGFGTLLDYISVCENVSYDHKLQCLNMYNLLGVDIYTVNDMTVDGIHPSQQARVKYADLLTQAIEEIEESGYTSLDSEVRIQAAIAAANEGN